MDHLTPNFRPAKQRAGKSEIGCPAGPRELELVEGRKSRRGRGLAMQIVRRRVCEITDILCQYLPPSRNCKFVHEPIEYEPSNLNVFTRNYRFLRSKSNLFNDRYYPSWICSLIDNRENSSRRYRSSRLQVEIFVIKYDTFFRR